VLADMQAQLPAGQLKDRAQRVQGMRGAIALAEGNASAAIGEFTAAKDGICRICVLPGLAQAYDAAGNRDSAIAVYRRYVDTPDTDHFELDAFFLAAAQKRLGELYEARGDKAGAVKAYAAFVALWKHADADLQPAVADVRQRIETLSGREAAR
jgi:tetratricopeptide (TPR) repeat protein